MTLDNRPPSEKPTNLEWLSLLARPGIGIKRWLITGLAGLLILTTGIAFALSVSVSETLVEVARRATFARSMPPVMRGALTAAVGLGLASVSTFMLYKQLAFGARYTQGNRGIIESLAHHQTRSSGPKIVAIGGGTGLSTLLRGLKAHTDNLSAVVTVADDGGSSGRLRDELGIAPPGDARQCLVALSESEPLMEQVLSYRFSVESDLGGHNFGNLLLAALVDIEGDFHHALESAGKLLIVKGRVLPSSISTKMRLAARTTSGTYLAGESAVGHAGESIETIWVEPPDCQPNPAVLEAIADADLIVMGPGSLYTSILPNFLISGVSDAVNATKVPKVLVCNIATQAGETDDLGAADHLAIFERHSKVQVTHFLMNSQVRAVEESPEPHAIEPEAIANGAVSILMRDVGGGELSTHHDPEKLSRAVMDVLSQ
ncbi:MAG: YvcK family protein [Chloroflexi bacterium]|nr:YvcK family protein [Chloroflexota bacterium]MDA1174900.1 YvcK family protein [Chloroflexota bacterium]